VTMKIRFSDFETHTRAVTLQIPTTSIKELRRAAFDCLKRFTLKKRVRLIGMRVSSLKSLGETGPENTLLSLRYGWRYRFRGRDIG